MKFLFGLVVALVLAQIGPIFGDQCSDCVQRVTQFNKYFGGEAGIAGEIILFTEGLCTMEKDPPACAKGVEAWWPKMSKVLFGNKDAPKATCVVMNKCDSMATPETMADDWSCPDCTKFVMDIGSVLLQPESAQHAQDLLDGKAFCQDPSVTSDPDTCKTYVDEFLPKAFQQLAYGFDQASMNVCHVVYNICPNKKNNLF